MPGHRAPCLAKEFDFILREMGSHTDVGGVGFDLALLNWTTVLKRDGRTGRGGVGGNCLHFLLNSANCSLKS